jgi:hypothetical protein
VDRSQHTFSSLDELRQIQFDARRSNSLENLRDYFQRVQSLRRNHVDDFDLQLLIAEVQEEIIERARVLNEQKGERSPGYFEENTPAHLVRRAAPNRSAREDAIDAAETPSEAPRKDSKTWQRATYLALFFTGIIFAAFFYLVQTARKINLTPAEVASLEARQARANAKNTPAQVPSNASNPTPAGPAIPPSNPTFRLYTDLVPGTVSIDGENPRDLSDGQLILDNLQPGRHSVKVAGRSASAVFSFDVAEKSAPRVVGPPSTSEALAVLVSAEDGVGHLITNAENSRVSLDGKPGADVGLDGLTLNDLGKTDHELQLMRDKDRQRFVLTYTPAPTLTAYVKSDLNVGTLVVTTAQDGAEVYINDTLYRRRTERGQARIPLKVGQYTIRVHKPGFIDPPPVDAEIKKSELTPLQFSLQPVREFAILQVKGALPDTMVYVDKELAGTTGADGTASISNVKVGDHTIELRHQEALPKRIERSFRTGEVVMLSGSDVMMEKAGVENTTTAAAAPAVTEAPKPNDGMELEGAQVRKGGGFVPYHVPNVSGHYTFAAQGRIGGFLKHSKLQWYAGYEDAQNYILFVLDGKHASIREVRDGKSVEVSRVPFNLDSNEWVQADVAVKPNEMTARVKGKDGSWSDMGSVSSLSRDFTRGKVGFYIPSDEEISVSNFKFSTR